MIGGARQLLSSVRLALLAIGRSKLRAALTVLGILIGVAAVVVVVALGTGVRKRVMGEIASLGANTIYVFPEAAQASGAKTKESGRLSTADAVALRRAPSVKNAVPFSGTGAQLVAEDANWATQVTASTRAYFEVRGFTFAKGGPWTEGDELIKARVMVIGDTVRENLFGDRDPMGRFVRVGKHAFRVIGVMAKKGQSPFGEDQDDRVVVPMSTFRTRVQPTTIDRAQLLLVQPSDEQTVGRASKQIEGILRQRHKIEPDDQPDFLIRTQAEFRRSQEGIFDSLTLLLSSIAAVSLLVGGIGVMNIMLVSVTERTREIGIRMAIGATEAVILTQFLVEAVVLTLIGGLFGTLAGLGLIAVLTRALGWAMELPLEAVVAAVGTSAVIGLFFGFFPARRAARLDPIVALRSE